MPIFWESTSVCFDICPGPCRPHPLRTQAISTCQYSVPACPSRSSLLRFPSLIIYFTVVELQTSLASSSWWLGLSPDSLAWFLCQGGKISVLGIRWGGPLESAALERWRRSRKGQKDSRVLRCLPPNNTHPHWLHLQGWCWMVCQNCLKLLLSVVATQQWSATMWAASLRRKPQLEKGQEFSLRNFPYLLLQIGW